MMRTAKKIGLGLLLGMLFVQFRASAQCQLFDFYGNPSNNPTWYSCSGGNFALNIQSPNSIGAWSINWGDGSPVQTGASLVPPAAITHVYPAAVAIYNVTFIATSTGCTVNGTVVMEQATSSSIQIPVGGLTQACAPQTMQFINSSTNTSTTTVFTWDFGDGSPLQVFDHTNLGQTISHTYQVGTVTCETVVTLTAQNNCNTVQGGPSQATFNPIRIWDIDDAAITSTATILCWPDNQVTLTNTTYRNCLFQGNIYQRYEYWNFGDYWGLGYDSIIDWRAWPPTFPHTLSYPAIGTYTATLLDSNLCGIDAATITIQIVPPPTAAASASATTICAGQSIVFTNSSSSNATDFIWNFGDGSPLVFSGSTTITRVFPNAGNFNVTLTAAVGGPNSPCQDMVTIPIEVLPAPEAVIDFDLMQACDLLEVTFTDNSNGTIIGWEWSFGNGNISTLQNPPMQTYSSVGAYNVALTVESPNGCKNTDTQIVRVHQSPVANFMLQDICVGAQGSFTDLSSSMAGDPIISWDWDFGDGNTSTQQNPNHSYAAFGSYVVTLEVSTAHCSDTHSFTVNAEPAPTSVFTMAPLTGCGPLTVDFNNASVGGVTYTWLFGDGGGSGDENPTHTFTNFGNQDSVYTVRLIARTAFGCTDTSSANVTVNPGAQALFQSFYTPACAPLPANFLNNSTNASGYIWDFGDGSPLSTETNPSHEFENNTFALVNYTVTLIALTPNGCNDTTTASIQVYPKPNFDFTLVADTGCAPYTVQFPFVTGGIAYAWSFGDGTISNAPNPQHTYMNNTLLPITYTAQLVATSAFGCNDTASAQVVVNPNPITQFSVNLTAGCGPLTVTFDNQSILADSVFWSYGDGATSDTMAQFHSHTFENNTTQTITYTVQLTAFTENGCSRTFTRNVEVYPPVVAAFTHPLEGCSPLTFTFQNNSQNASIYQWDLGNGVVNLAQNPIGGYQTNLAVPDTFDIQLIATSIYGCEDTARSSLVVYPKPNASIIPNTTAGCAPLDVTFQNNSSIANSFNWNYGEGQISDTTALLHTHTFNSTSFIQQVYAVSMVASTDFGCRDTATVNITVYPEVTAAFSPDAEGCSPLPVNFINQSFGAATYFWAFGDGNESFLPNASYTFVNLSDTTMEFNVRMVGQSGFGCVDTAYQTVRVFPLPQVSLVVTDVEGCYPADVTLANYSNGAEIYEWNYGDGTFSDTGDSSHVHTFVNPGLELETYVVTLTGTSDEGCTASRSIEVDIIPQITALVDPPAGGCSPYEAAFTNNSTGAFTYLWDFGDGTFSQETNPSYTYTNLGVEDQIYTVTFIAQSLWGCGDTLVFDVPVSGFPQAAFIAAPTVQTFPSATVELSNLSSANSTASYTWFWGDGTSVTSINPEEPATYTYDTWGVYNIILQVGNNLCNDTAFQQIRIDPPLPIADFEGGGTGCMPLRVDFTNTSTYDVSYLWNFGDGTISNDENPMHVYYQPGTYNVALTVTGPGGQNDVEIKTGIVVVHPRADAFFTVNPPVISVPDQVFFLNLSANATIFEWDFGDGATSTEFAPYHFYESTGWHPVTLLANNEFNCPDSFRVEQAVLGNVESQIDFPNAFTPNGNGPSGGFWTIDEMFNNDVFFPIYKGVDDFEMQIFNRWGELIFESKDVRQGWDGYYRGKLCQQDVYVWRVRVTFMDGGELTDMGDVTLIR